VNNRGQTPIIQVIRHWKERVSKCSLRFLHGRPGFAFARARPGSTFDATGYTLLGVDAPPLTLADAERPLLLLDSSWRHLTALRRCVTGDPVPRSIPGRVKTAYPRASKVFEDPAAGLASLEALYVALRILGHDDPSLLDGYHWKAEFLAELDAG
jgi:pre-rRNA-processing protein TSR3